MRSKGATGEAEAAQVGRVPGHEGDRGGWVKAPELERGPEARGDPRVSEGEEGRGRHGGSGAGGVGETKRWGVWERDRGREWGRERWGDGVGGTERCRYVAIPFVVC